jgi:hypothetical protein
MRVGNDDRIHGVVLMRKIIALIAAIMITAPVSAQVSYPTVPVDTSNMATKSDVQAVAATVPIPATSAPPGVNDLGTQGTMTNIYALANHTHASKARKGRLLVPTTNTLDVTFSPVFTTTPICSVTAETTKGDTNVVNAQIDGTPTATGMTMRITRTAVTNASLLNLTILSVPTPIATYAHYICLEP